MLACRTYAGEGGTRQRVCNKVVQAVLQSYSVGGAPGSRTQQTVGRTCYRVGAAANTAIHLGQQSGKVDSGLGGEVARASRNRVCASGPGMVGMLVGFNHGCRKGSHWLHGLRG
jgi:hypothetical protein